MKDNRAITLIALIITIIVLLILSGISIAFLTGDNGILSKTQTAKVESEKSAELEKINLKIQSLRMNKNGVVNLVDLNEFTNPLSINYDREINLDTQIQPGDQEARIIMDDYIFIVNSSLKANIIGDKSMEDIYLFKSGDLCTSITNGWDKYEQGGGARVTFESNKVILQTVDINYWGHYITTKNAINLNHYKKLFLEYDSSSGYYTTAWNGNVIHFFILDETGNTTIKSIDSNPSTAKKIIEIDISDLQGKYKIQVNGGSLNQVNVYNVWIKQ